MKLFLLGATGNTGRRILKFALARGHEVTAFVRDPSRLRDVIGGNTPQGLRVATGDINDLPTLADAMTGHDAVINAAGYVTEGEGFTRLVNNVVEQTASVLGAEARFWQLGGAAVLNIPGTSIMAVDLPLVPKIYETHRTNFNLLRRSSLDWSMLCPGPMIESANGQATKKLRISVDEWPVPRTAFTYVFPKVTWALAFRQKIPELTISYEDAAEVILNNLDPNGHFSRKRVGVALPIGFRSFKAAAPGK